MCRPVPTKGANRKAANVKDDAAPLCPDVEFYRGSSARPGSWHDVPPCVACVVATAPVAATVAVAPMFDALAVNVVGAEWWVAVAEPAARSAHAAAPGAGSGFGVDLAEPFVALAVHCSAGFPVGAHVHLTGCESVDGFDFSVGCVVVATPGWRAVVLLAQFAAACGVRSALRYSHRRATPSAVLAGGDRLANCENGCAAVTDLQGSHPIGGCGAG